MLNILLLALLALAGIFALFILRQPPEFAVRREAFIAAPPRVVFDLVNDFHAWQAWSPWAKRDPGARIAYAGPEAGVGAGFSWAGNREIGEGRMLITESVPAERIHMQLDFIKPFPATNQTIFTFKPDGEGTRMTWQMQGRNGPLARAVCFFMNMDRMVGRDFEAGMANIAATARDASTEARL